MKGGFQKKWRLLRELCADLGELRRGEYRAARLAMERARLKRAEEKARNSDHPCEAEREGARSRVPSGHSERRTQEG